MTRTDTERLEWLEKQAKTCTVYMDGTSIYVIAGDAHNMRGHSFREAIDAAMNNESP